jgi:hypothetical protein
MCTLTLSHFHNTNINVSVGSCIQPYCKYIHGKEEATQFGLDYNALYDIYCKSGALARDPASIQRRSRESEQRAVLRDENTLKKTELAQVKADLLEMGEKYKMFVYCF